MAIKSNQSKKIKYTKKYCLKRTGESDLILLNPKAAGIDIGAREIVIAVPVSNREYDVWVFGSFTKDLREIVELLKQHEVDCVAMESTGNYWIPIYEMLQDNGIRPVLANSKNLKNISGKKSDVLDAEWLATLLKYGLISGAFRPKETLVLRGYIRQRSLLIEHRSPHILHMDKSLIEMNLRLSNVVSDIVGLTGLSIIRAIVQGERNPKKLATFRDERCQNSEEVIEMSLEGHYKEEQVFALKQALEAYEFFQHLIDECEKEIEKAINVLEDIPEQAISPIVKIPETEIVKGKKGNQIRAKMLTNLMHIILP